jgi:ribosomal protein S18 acetylase RimI-like enzyme
MQFTAGWVPVLRTVKDRPGEGSAYGVWNAQPIRPLKFATCRRAGKPARCRVRRLVFRCSSHVLLPLYSVGTFQLMTSTNITVRPPAEDDASTLAEIQISAWRAAYRGVMTDEYLDAMDSERYAEGWARNIANPKPGTVQLVAQAGNQVVGFCIFGPATGDADSAFGQLYAINVHPQWWAKGAGSALFSAAEEKLATLGYDKAFLWVEANNKRAIDFYAKRGWLICS